MWFHQLATILFLSHIVTVEGHPGVVADGRGSCGIEYSTFDQSYYIPDIEEAWYVRRVSTCSSPSFWTSFDVTKQNQQLYIAVISPEIIRFQDNIQFHALVIWSGCDNKHN